MSVSLFMAGFEVSNKHLSIRAEHVHECSPPGLNVTLAVQVWDVTMQDLCSGSLTLKPFKAVVFVGGFSYADVLGSAKGEP